MIPRPDFGPHWMSRFACNLHKSSSSACISLWQPVVARAVKKMNTGQNWLSSLQHVCKPVEKRWTDDGRIVTLDVATLLGSVSEA